MLDRRLEEGLRALQASPEDASASLRVALGLIRAERSQEARGPLEPTFQALSAAAGENPLAAATHTALSPLPQSPLHSDAAALIATSLGGDAVKLATPLFEAGSRSGDSELALAALRAILSRAPSPLELARLCASSLRRGSAACARLLHEALPPARTLPFVTRLGWAALIRRFELPSARFVSAEPLEGLRRLAANPPCGRAIPCPLAPAPSAPAIERQPRRQFGAHGGDYEFGTVMALKTRLDHRFLLFDAAALEELRAQLSELAMGVGLPPFEASVFAEGYGFAWPEALRPPDDKAEAFAEVVDAWGILPGQLHLDGRRPYDIIPDDETLTERFRRDLASHSARSKRSADGPFWSSPAMDLLGRVGPGAVRSSPPLDDLLPLADELYSAPGRAALRLFAASLDSGPKVIIPFSED